MQCPSVLAGTVRSETKGVCKGELQILWEKMGLEFVFCISHLCMTMFVLTCCLFIFVCVRGASPVSCLGFSELFLTSPRYPHLEGSNASSELHILTWDLLSYATLHFLSGLSMQILVSSQSTTYSLGWKVNCCLAHWKFSRQALLNVAYFKISSAH